MRVLGFLFLVVLVVAVVGVFRGWFTVATTSHAGETKNVTVGVNTDRMREDAAKLAELPERVAAQVRAMGKKVSADESEIEGTVMTADTPARRLVVTSGAETLDLTVPSTVRIERGGESVTFEQLRPSSRVRMRFRHDGDARKLARIEILDR
jgi:hypothetical protein